MLHLTALIPVRLNPRSAQRPGVINNISDNGNGGHLVDFMVTGVLGNANSHEAVGRNATQITGRVLGEIPAEEGNDDGDEPQNLPNWGSSN